MVGKYVINFGILGAIREVREDGSLVLENPRMGKWIADPEKCTEYKEDSFPDILGSGLSEREIERILQEEPDEAKAIEAINKFKEVEA